jgi:hypothetical protein
MIIQEKRATGWPVAPLVATACMLFISGCATQAPPIVAKESLQASTVQRNAQQTAAALSTGQPLLKRKIALGRITNETNYGQSLLRDRQGDPSASR